MADFGVQPTGFVRKPLSTVLSEIEASLETEFGPGVIQTSQSPLGQINGLMADMITELWEFAEDVYQSYDPDQAEGTRLDTLGRIRLISRGAAETDALYRNSITNINTARITYADFVRALMSVDGVYYARVFANEEGKGNKYNMPPNTVTAAVLGGDDESIVDVVNDYVVPGITMYGNVVVNSEFDGFCRAIKFVRPLEIDVDVTVYVKLDATDRGCPAPSPVAISAALAEYMNAYETRLWNGQRLDAFYIRQFIESRFGGVQFLRATIIRQDPYFISGEFIDFSFFEIAQIKSVTVEGVQ